MLECSVPDRASFRDPIDYYSEAHETKAQAFLPALSRPTFGWAREGPSSRNPKRPRVGYARAHTRTGPIGSRVGYAKAHTRTGLNWALSRQ